MEVKMEVRKILEEYNSLKVSITIAENKIFELENEILECKSANLDGMLKPTGFTSSNIENFIISKEEKIEEKKKYIEETKNKLKIVEDLVKILKNYNQEIISMRYYQKMSIEKISNIKDKSYVAIQKTIDNSIQQMQNFYDKNNK